MKTSCKIILVLLLACNIVAQNKYKTLNNSDVIEYRKKDGLPSNNFKNAVKTKDGYLWFSGPEGTFRFDGYEFAYIGSEYGIPEMQSVYYDSTKNILYFASPEKFATFDGKEFKSYDSSSGYRLNANQGQIISFVKGDSKGRIWVGSYTPFTNQLFNGSLINFKDDKFTLYDSLSFPLDNAKGFIETPFGDLIFTSYGTNTQNGDGAYIALLKREKFTRIDDSFGFNYFNTILEDNYSSIIDSKGNTWIAFTGNSNYAKAQSSTGTGVLVYDGDSFKDFPGLEKYFTDNKSIGDIFCDNKNDKIYVSLSQPESKKITSLDIQILELKNDSWQPSSIVSQIFKTPSNDKVNFNYNFSRFIKNSKDKNVTLLFRTIGISQTSIDPTQLFVENNGLWKKTDAYNGIPILELTNGTLLSTAKGIGFLSPSNSVMYKKSDGVLFPETTIPDFYPDRRGLVWISYSYSEITSYIVLSDYGLNVWDGEKLRIISTKEGLKSNTSFAPYQDTNFNLWIPTDKGITQLREIQNNEGEWLFKLKNIELENGKDYNTSNVIERNDHQIIVFQNYVRPQYGPVTKAEFFLGKITEDKLVEIKSPFSAELQAQPYQLFSLREDNKGQLWLAGQFAGSLEKLSSVKTEIKILRGGVWIDPPIEWNVPNEQLHFVGELDNGAYYLTAGHFYIFNGEKFIDLSDSINQFADYRLLKGASVAGTMTNIQSGKKLYIRLRGRGLVIFDGKYLKFLTPRNSILPTDIHNPVVDHFGNIFFGSHAGAVKVSGEEVSLYYDDEMITEGGTTVTSLDMNDNLIKFYTGIGVAVEKNRIQSDILKISSITINDKPYYYKLPTDLKYSENSILFNYSVLNFSSPDQIMYEHTLEGYDKEWSRSSNLSFTEYQNLPPGNYKFRVKAEVANNEKANEASFTFSIAPPIWRTWWAYTFYVLVFAGFLYSIRKIELKRQRKNSAIKESQLRAEAAELQAKAAEAQSRVIQAENDRKSQELEEARQLQLSMLPKELPKVETLDIAVYMKTATEVGGDYYDFSIAEDRTLNVGLGDATGHGMQAGTIVTLLKGLFTSEVSKKELLTFLRDTSNAMKGIELGRLMMAFSLLKIKGNHIQFSSAGMPPLYIYRNELKIVEEIDMQGMPLGAIRNFEYKLYETEIKGGDCVLLMSDGYPELSNDKNEQIGYQLVKTQFAEIAEKNPDEIIEYFKNNGSAWVNDKDPDDDVTFVVIKVN